VICIVAIPLSCGDTVTGSTFDQAGYMGHNHGVLYSLSVNESTYVTASLGNSSSGVLFTVFITTDSFSVICENQDFYTYGIGQCTKLLTPGKYFIIVTSRDEYLYQLDVPCNDRMSNSLRLVYLCLLRPLKRTRSGFSDFAPNYSSNRHVRTTSSNHECVSTFWNIFHAMDVSED